MAASSIDWQLDPRLFALVFDLRMGGAAPKRRRPQVR